MENNTLALIGNTPLVHLQRVAGSCTIYAKVEKNNPSGSIKDRAALYILRDALDKGQLRPGDTIIEATSGNMGISLALVGAALKLHVVLVMPASMSLERRQLMAAYGAKLELSTEGGMQAAVQRAQHLAEEYGFFQCRQFDNPANVKAHIQGTGAEIIRDMHMAPRAFVAGIGTGGTLCGTGKRLKEAWPGIQIIGAEPQGSRMIANGTAGPHGIQGIGANFIPGNYNAQVVDSLVAVSDEEAMDMARALAKHEGLLVGISSGANVAAALKVAKQLPPGAAVVTVLPDTGERYLSSGLFNKKKEEEP